MPPEAASASGRSPENTSTCLIAEEAAETLLPLADGHGVTIETSGDITSAVGSRALLLQMTTNLLHNAIVHNLPEHGTVQVKTVIGPESVMLTVDQREQQVPDDRPALALLDARTAFRPAAMKAYIAKRMTSASTVIEGQADP
jgi:light-regulated signal transduction histidine kinase (bacteriophytochrome)